RSGAAFCPHLWIAQAHRLFAQLERGFAREGRFPQAGAEQRCPNRTRWSANSPGNGGQAARPLEWDRLSDRVYRRDNRPEQEWRTGTDCDLKYVCRYQQQRAGESYSDPASAETETRNNRRNRVAKFRFRNG